MEIQAMSGIRFFHPKNSPCSSLGPRTPALIYGERIALYLVSFTPKTHLVRPWAPNFLPHKMAEPFYGVPELHPALSTVVPPAFIGIWTILLLSKLTSRWMLRLRLRFYLD